MLGKLGDGQPVRQTAGARRRLQNPVAQADGPDCKPAQVWDPGELWLFNAMWC
jgi:hypothetical protein